MLPDTSDKKSEHNDMEKEVDVVVDEDQTIEESASSSLEEPTTSSSVSSTEIRKDEVEQTKPEVNAYMKLKAWLIKWHLPLMLISGIFIGYLAPTPGSKADEADFGGVCFREDLCIWNSVGSLCVMLIFLMSGMKLKTDAIKDAIAARKAALVGTLSILFITPCISFAVVNGSFNGLKEFGIGLALFFSMPTTLSSGVIIVGQARGNVALALMLTVITNVVGVFTAPLFVSGFMNLIGSEVGISLDPVPIILQLLFTLLLPLFVGKVLRRSEWVRDQVKRFGFKMKILSSLFLAIIPWMKVSSSADALKQVNGPAFGLMLLAGIGVHLVFLIFNYLLAHTILKLKLPEEIAVVIIASQKTLPVAITILEFLPVETIGSPGLVAIPMIVSHLMQIIVDSFIASKYSAKVTALELAALDGVK